MFQLNAWALEVVGLMGFQKSPIENNIITTAHN